MKTHVRSYIYIYTALLSVHEFSLKRTIVKANMTLIAYLLFSFLLVSPKGHLITRTSVKVSKQHFNSSNNVIDRVILEVEV